MGGSIAIRLLHLGLPVRDEGRSLHFYDTYFGFDPGGARRYPDGTVIVRNADGFDLALHAGAAPDRLPSFLHFGFQLPGADAVHGLLARMEADGVRIPERWDEPGYVGFKCLDPDGWVVEVYWETDREGVAALMLVQETVTYLEMTSPDQLRPGRPAPAAVELDRLDRASWRLLKATYERVGAPFDWQGRRAGPAAWSDERWQELLARPAVQAWVARVGGEVAGLVELELQPGGEVEIVVFGLAPEFVGKGFGAHLLTLATTLAWNAGPLDGPRVRRVWLHTSSRDHPHAKPNYERRGFRVFRTEQRQREILPVSAPGRTRRGPP